MYKQLIKLLSLDKDDVKKISIDAMKENYNDEEYWKTIFQMIKLENDFIIENIGELNI
jgi:hypothetical protein